MNARVWVHDRRWQTVFLPGSRTCSWPRCRRGAIARVPRRTGWYHYCEEHLAGYGRRVAGGRVEIEVAVGSPAAERGYVGEA